MKQELNYIRCGDYYIPDIRLPEENRPIGLSLIHIYIRYNSLERSIWEVADITEKEKSYAGMLYQPGDPELAEGGDP